MSRWKSRKLWTMILGAAATGAPFWLGMDLERAKEMGKYLLGVIIPYLLAQGGQDWLKEWGTRPFGSISPEEANNDVIIGEENWLESKITHQLDKASLAPSPHPRPVPLSPRPNPSPARSRREAPPDSMRWPKDSAEF